MSDGMTDALRGGGLYNPTRQFKLKIIKSNDKLDYLILYATNMSDARRSGKKLPNVKKVLKVEKL